MAYRTYNNGWKNAVGIRITINAGGCDEAEATEGFTHFAEHLMFSGTRRLDRHSLRSEHERLFIRLEAVTSHERVNVIALVDRSDFHEAICLLHEMIHDWRCRADVFDDEKRDLQSEMREYRESRDFERRRIIANVLPYGGKPVIGRPSTISRLRYADVLRIKRHWNALLKRAPIDVDVFGNVDDAAKRLVLEKFGKTVGDCQTRLTWRMKSSEWLTAPSFACWRVRHNIGHPLFVIMDRIYYLRWQRGLMPGGSYEFSRHEGQTTFGVAYRDGVDEKASVKFFLDEVTQKEFLDARDLVVRQFRRAMDGIEPFESMSFLGDFSFRNYGELPSEDSQRICRWYQGMTHKRFREFQKNVMPPR